MPTYLARQVKIGDRDLRRGNRFIVSTFDNTRRTPHPSDSGGGIIVNPGIGGKQPPLIDGQ
jgi:hypothetical protein